MKIKFLLIPIFFTGLLSSCIQDEATTHMVEQHLIRILSLPFRKVHICA